MKTSVSKLYICIVLIVLSFVPEYPSKCVMRGYSELNMLNYLYNGSALPIDKNGSQIFRSYCPFLLPEGYKIDDPIEMCCDEDQLQNLVQNLQMVESIIPNCEICKENIIMLTCHMICNPEQSSFIEADSKQDDPVFVESLTLTITKEFSEGLLESCEGVKFSNTITPLLDLLCTSKSTVCTPNDFLESLFSYSPFQIITNIVAENSTIKALKIVAPTPLLCSNSYTVFDRIISACTCSDCEASCVSTNEVVDEPFLIFGTLSIYQLIIICLYSLMVLMICITVLVAVCWPKHKFYAHRMASEWLVSLDINDYENSDILPPITEPIGIRLKKFIRRSLELWGLFVCKNSYIIFTLSIALLVSLCFGVIFRFNVTSDPIEIWSPPNGEFRKQKEFFDKNFGPFFRTEQIIIKPKKWKSNILSVDGTEVEFGPLFKSEVLFEIFQIQKHIEMLDAKYFDKNSKTEKSVKINDICHKPLAPFSEKCVQFSITQYFHNDASVVDFNSSDNLWADQLFTCMYNPSSIEKQILGVPCISDFYAPVEPRLVMGEYDDKPHLAKVFIITYIVENSLDHDKLTAIKSWESEYLKYLKNYSHPKFDITFSAERSIDDEIERQTHTEFFTVLVSYVVMFLYVSVSLGSTITKNWKSFLVNQKFCIGLVGVLLVLLSVVAAVGAFCYMNFKVNWIILEVLPFLALAIGVDNIFIMVNELDKLRMKDVNFKDIPNLIGEMLGNVGHGMIVSAIAQVTTFLVGALSDIPAVKLFSMFAATTISINFVMQMSLFIVVIYFDSLREQANRISFCCCVKFSYVEETNQESYVEKAFKLFYKLILHKVVRVVILFIFITVWNFSIYILPQVKVGLDQTSALSYDSYVLPFYQDAFRYIKMGPPVYFIVMPNFRYENEMYRKLVCNHPDCSPYSLPNILAQYAKMPKVSKIASPPYSWVDTYLDWTITLKNGQCCSYKLKEEKRVEFCPAYNVSLSMDCTPCNRLVHIGKNVSDTAFVTLLPAFLQDIPTPKCPYGGKPLYGNMVVLNSAYYGTFDLEQIPIYTSAFMTYHTPIRSSEDMFMSLFEAVKISEVISKAIDHQVIPYSSFYIFYESFLSIWKEAGIAFGISFGAILVMNFFLFGFCFRMAILITFLTFIMNVVNLGCMYVLKIEFNPISLVNLIMFIGINVEFLSHIGRGFIQHPSPSRTDKALMASVSTGSSVFRGIVMTKLIGIIVFAFSKSLLFKVYYFQMYMCAILVGTLHGLILLPVLLSFIGPISEHYGHVSDLRRADSITC